MKEEFVWLYRKIKEKDVKRIPKVLLVIGLTAKNFFKKNSPTHMCQIRVELSRTIGGKEFFEANLVKRKKNRHGRVYLIIENHPFGVVDLKCAEEQFKRGIEGHRFSVRGIIDGHTVRGAIATLRVVHKKEILETAYV